MLLFKKQNKKLSYLPDLILPERKMVNRNIIGSGLRAIPLKSGERVGQFLF